jgi:hypothetical protein
MFDSGSSTGDIIGHSKTLNAVSVRRQRPFRAATGSDDVTIGFHHGESIHFPNVGLKLKVNHSGVPFKYASVGQISWHPKSSEPYPDPRSL